jgi:hypothetical protein
MSEALLELRAVSKRFAKRLDAVERLARLLGAKVAEHTVHAVDRVDLVVGRWLCARLHVVHDSRELSAIS